LKVGGCRYTSSSGSGEKNEVHPQMVQETMRHMAMAAARVRRRKGGDDADSDISYDRVLDRGGLMGVGGGRRGQ